MSILKNQKHEVTYNTDTEIVTYNGRNFNSTKTPARLFVDAGTKPVGPEGWVIDGKTYYHKFELKDLKSDAWYSYNIITGEEFNQMVPPYKSADIPYVKYFTSYQPYNYKCYYGYGPTHGSLDFNTNVDGEIELQKATYNECLAAAYVLTEDGITSIYFNLIEE